MYCNIGQPYCNILQYAYYRIVSLLVFVHFYPDTNKQNRLKIQQYVSVSHVSTILCNARCYTAAHAVNVTLFKRRR